MVGQMRDTLLTVWAFVLVAFVLGVGWKLPEHKRPIFLAIAPAAAMIIWLLTEMVT